MRTLVKRRDAAQDHRYVRGKYGHYRQILDDLVDEVLDSEEEGDDFCVPSEERRIIFLRGKLQAFAECAAECDKMLGHSDSMPSEVSQSEDVR